MSLILLTGYFNSQPDPQRKVVMPADDVSKMVLNRSATGHVIETYVVHDCLSDKFIEDEINHTHGCTSFLKLKPRSDRSLNVGRFYLYRDIIKLMSVDSMVFICDLFDCYVNINPLKVFSTNGCYFSIEYHKYRNSCNNPATPSGKWLHDVLRLAYGHIPACTVDRPIVCAGVFGGKRELVLPFVEDMCNEFDQLGKGMADIDMAVFNKLFYEKYERKCGYYSVGSPLVSAFKAFDKTARCCFIHK